MPPQSTRCNVVRLLVDIAPDCIEDRDDAGMPPFLAAVCHNALDVVKILIEHGTDIFVTDEEGRTAIHVGAKFNAIKVLR
ncbi:ankyrin repeat protein, partial [Cooperia oncophora]